MDEGTRAVIYVRISLDRTGEELGVARQREDCTKLVAARGFSVVEVIVDNDVSASGKRVRPGFERVLDALAAGTANAVVAWDMTRLTRNQRDTVRLLETGEKAGAVLMFARGSDLDLSTPAGRLTAGILAGVARHEIEVKADRQRRAVVQAAQQGRRVGGRRPFGYESDGMTIREDEAAALRQAYDDVLAGLPLTAVARRINDAGFKTPQKKRDGSESEWSRETIRPTLLNPRYAGIRAVGHGHGNSKTFEEIAPAQWPGIVDEEVFRGVVAILSDPERRNGTPGAIGLLTGIGLCGVCDATVHRGGSPKNVAGAHYRCSGSTGHIARKASPVDEYVSLRVVERLTMPDAADLLTDPTRPDAAELSTRASALRAKLDGLAADYADGILTRSQLATATGRLRSRLAAVEAEMTAGARASLLSPLVTAEDVAAAWATLDVDRRRAVIDTLCTVTLIPPGRGVRTFRPETVVITPR